MEAGRREAPVPREPRLRTDGVNTHGAAAKVVNFGRLGKKARPGTFGNVKVGEREYPKTPSVKKPELCRDPISADPICPAEYQ